MHSMQSQSSYMSILFLRNSCLLFFQPKLHILRYESTRLWNAASCLMTITVIVVVITTLSSS